VSARNAGVRDVGVIGIGQMGRGIARRLDGAGRLRAVSDPSAAAIEAAQLSPEVAVAEPDALGALCARVLFVVPGSDEIAACLLGEGGLLAAARPGMVVLDLTTSDPAATARLAGAAAEHGVAYLDCGMSGGAVGADEGRLTLMVGGEAAVLEGCRDLLEIIAAKVFHVGASGAGHTMKLIHNLVCHTVFLATCEGALMAERAGIGLARAIEVLNAGNARSYASEVRFPRHIVSGAFDGRSRVANLEKDVRMAVALAERIGARLALGRQSALILARALEEGGADRDFTTLYLDLERLLALGSRSKSGG
jgi:3-hydroxyisobutyrate dehydrogenase